MQKFNFKLEKVLSYKEQQEEMFQQELAQIKVKLKEANDELNRLLHNKEELQIKIKEQEKGKIDLQKAINYRDYIEVLKVKIKEQEEVVSEIEAILEECRQKLLEKKKECEMLKKLKERKFTEYQTEFFRKEQKSIDELATNNFNRNVEEIEAVGGI